MAGHKGSLGHFQREATELILPLEYVIDVVIVTEGDRDGDDPSSSGKGPSDREVA